MNNSVHAKHWMKLSDATSLKDRLTRDMQLVKAATNYRLAKQPERALKLLQSFKPPASSGWITVGYHGYEIGACYEALGDPQAAVAAYLCAVEDCPGISANTDLDLLAPRREVSHLARYRSSSRPFLPVQ